MSVIDEDTLDRLLDLVGPYANDIHGLAGWIESRMDQPLDEMITELDGIISDEEDSSKRTDFRILRNAIGRL